MDETELRAASSPEIAACILSQRDSAAGALYRVIPSCDELKVSEDAFLAFSYSRQCIAILRDEPSTCTCHIVAGAAGRATECSSAHPTSCPLGDGYVRRHDAGCSALHDLLRALPQTYVVPQYRSAPHGDSPDFDVTNFPNYGDLAYVEYSVVDLLQAAHINTSRHTPKHVTRHRDDQKPTSKIGRAHV